MYGIYDVKDNEQCVGIFNNRKEVTRYFNTTANCIGSAITKKQKREDRYLIKKIESEKK